MAVIELHDVNVPEFLRELDVNLFLTQQEESGKALKELEEKHALTKEELSGMQEEYSQTKVEYERLEQELEELDAKMEALREEIQKNALK